MKNNNTICSIINCYKAMSFFNPSLNYWITIQTFILILSRSCIAFFTLALSYFINKKTHITLWEAVAISVIGFYCFNRMLEWIISAIHGRFHTQFILPSALNFIDQIIYMMLRHHNDLKIEKNPVELAALLNKKTDARGFLGFLFHHISTPILELIVCAFLLMSLGFSWLGFFLIPLSFIYLFISIKLLPKIKTKLMEALSISGQTASVFSSSLEKSSLATSFGTIDTLVKHLEGITKKESAAFKKSALLNDFMATLLNLPLALFACLFFYFGAIQVEQGLTTYGGFAALISIVMNSFSQLKNLTFAFDGLTNSLTSLSLHLDIFQKCKNINTETQPRLTIDKFRYLTLENLQVKHNTRSLFNINLTVNKGDKIFIVGSSGAGKSSLIKALLGYQKYDGNILINNTEIDLSQFPFAWMPQEYQAIEGTIRFNLRLGNPEATDDEMLEVLRQVNLYDKIISIGGLDTNLTYQGANLSGGENQRLSLARCLLSKNPIMLLDEPSSALDMFLEKSIFSNLIESEKSALIIVHRLKAIPKGATILFMQNNNIYSVDKIESLLENNTEFKNLYYSHDI